MDEHALIRELTPTELAVLALSNSQSANNEEMAEYGYRLFLGKGALFWGAAIAYFSEHQILTEPVLIERDPIVRHLDRSLRVFKQRFLPDILRGTSRTSLAGAVVRSVGGMPGRERPNINALATQVEYAQQSLERRELIRDPIVETIAGVPVMIFGFAPLAISVRRRKGEELAVKLNALFWQGGYVWKSDGDWEFAMKIRTFGLAEHFKRQLREQFSDKENKED